MLLLGAAYGILEEGIALSTLYNPLAGPVGKLGYYGHFLGVSWIWVSSILPVHMIFSISLPILLLGLALPETANKSLIVSARRIVMLFVILGVDVLSLFLLVLREEHFWMGLPVFVGSFSAICVLLLLARNIPRDFASPLSDLPKARPLVVAIIGVLFYFSVLLIELGVGPRIPAVADLILVVLVETIFLICTLAATGRQNNSRQLIALAAGLVIPIAFIGVISEARFPLILVVDLAFGIFMWKLWRMYGSQVNFSDLRSAGRIT